MKLHVKPGDQPPRELTIEPRQALLLGREPDPDALRGSLAGIQVHSVSLPSNTVSGNHVVVWREDEAYCLRDIGSRNGTWVRAPSGAKVTVAGADPREPLSLRLAVTEGVDLGEPPDAWPGAGGNLPSAVADALAAWFKQIGLPVQATVAPREAVPDAPGAEQALVSVPGGSIVLTPHGTAAAQWSEVLERVHRYIARQTQAHRSAERSEREGFVLASSEIRAVHWETVLAARQGLRVVLQGPSGSGKEGLARAYDRATGRGGPFVGVNCSTLTKEFRGSELFGAERGSFSGAVKRIFGAVERAERGTLFLDEVGELAPDVQALLLRFLDNEQYEVMGQYGVPQDADVRIVCATNRDLREEVQQGRFRRDLWYRLSGQVIHVPPLSERFADVVAYLHTRAAGRFSAHDVCSEEALEVLRRHPWDGNFRELTNFVTRIPGDLRRGELSAAACAKLLAAGALVLAPPPERPTPTSPATPPHLLDRALQAFAEDRDVAVSTWDDQKELLERYLKPLLFGHLAEVSLEAVPPPGPERVAFASRLAARIGADRGTALKQLSRLADRFAPAPPPR
ncbi:MAG TPA: sigma 54-interacting transcriptional regulator [Myxococcaceae bacterium]|nr:sigma 54-interacting transcriptional regulator [Myxococcaceae bacterium]